MLLKLHSCVLHTRYTQARQSGADNKQHVDQGDRRQIDSKRFEFPVAHKAGHHRLSEAAYPIFANS